MLSRRLIKLYKNASNFNNFLSHEYYVPNPNPPCCFATSSSQDVPQEVKPTPKEIAEMAERVPVEKKSLTRGLTLNKFEKDFVIYPEYEHNKELERIRNFVQNLGGEMQRAFEQTGHQQGTEIAKGRIPTGVDEVLRKFQIYASVVPKEYGGMTVCQKDLLQLCECLGGNNLSVFTTFQHLNMATNLISQFGTAQQKERYLRGIASGQYRPAICIKDETSGIKPTGQVLSAKGGQQYLNAVKIEVLSALDANLFIVFANRMIGDVILPTCYVFEPELVQHSLTKIEVKDQLDTSGLQYCNFSTVVFDNVPVSNSDILGESENSGLMGEELSVTNSAFYGAAVVGYLKRTLANLCAFANQQVKGNLRLSDSHPVQRAITELAIRTYVLESIVYYIGGLVDEQLFLQQDIENAIVQKLANGAIRQSIMAVAEVAGLATTNRHFECEQLLRDAIAVMSLSDPDLHLTRRIAIPAIEAYVQQFGGLKTFMDKLTVSKLFVERRDNFEFMHPKLVHFIAEHVHPSLEPGARSLEFSMSRLDQMIDKLTTEKGIYINMDYLSLESISTVMENNLAMVATLARASRSYSIGLRNAENEKNWTLLFCMKAAEQSKNIILETLNNEEYMKINPRMTEIGLELLEANGYLAESPVEKNW